MDSWSQLALHDPFMQYMMLIARFVELVVFEPYCVSELAFDNVSVYWHEYGYDGSQCYRFDDACGAHQY